MPTNNYIMAIMSGCYIRPTNLVLSRNIFKPSQLILATSKFERQSTIPFGNMADNPDQKTYHKKASGNALATVRKHSKDHELKLFGSCFW